ncbi:cellulase family glycosylhydrolase [Halobacteria archaeon AArc-m2/3/4]|uniref:Cellulase family glycosylhydrolase n=1 Tax=Natronoglomus mannanivorans TaxID=2979990 RepID=A0ABT2QCS1_9EURY|nr:cellulase family glycosylhydrolase [Halobacteria archaeon AArc-m2/3/4]
MTDEIDETAETGERNRTEDRTEASASTTRVHTDSNRLLEGSRRDFLKTAGASAGALAFGTSMTGSVAAEPQIPTPPLHVDGNLIKDPEGNRVQLRGLNMADPKRLNVTAPARGKNAEHVVDLLTDQNRGWHPHVIRVPVQPIDIGEHTPGHIAGPPDPIAFTEAQLEDYLETHLDPVIDHLEQRGVYAIVDFHRHWRERGEDELWLFDQQTGDPNEALQEEVDMFWDIVAPRYADRSHVLYEVYNEPTTPGMWDDPMGENNEYLQDYWRYWKNLAQPWVDTIREHADNIVLVGSPSWTQSPEGYFVEPFDGDNLAYTYHIYPEHNASRQEDWEDSTINGQGVEGVYEEVPLFVTEFGWENPNIYVDGPLSGNTSGFGETFMDWLESSDGIHWMAWCADPIWRPVMFGRSFMGEDPYNPDDQDSVDDPYSEAVPTNCEELPCEWELLGGDDWMGEFIREKLEEYKDDGVPGGELTNPEDPTAPTDQWTGEVTETSIEVEWESVTDADGYRLYLDGSLTEETSTTTATIAGLEADTEYEIGISSVANSGESDVATMTVRTLSDDESEGPPEIDGIRPADTTGDGLYNDFTDSGSTTTTDVNVFFEHVDDPAVTEYPQYYDFDGNGEVSVTDVIELFESI